MNQLRPTVNIAKLQIPTGYEQQQREAATKRRLAEAMLSQGLGQENMTHWAQALGKLAQVYAGKRLDRQATEAEVGMQQGLRNDYMTARGQLMADIQAGKDPGYIMQTHGSNPLLQNDLKPFESAYSEMIKAPIEIDTARQRNENELTTFGGKMGRRKEFIGQYDNSPSAMVFANPDGSTQINPVAATAAGIAQGNLVLDGGPQTTGQMPGTSRVAQAMAGAPQPPAEERVMNFSDVQRFTQSMAPEGLRQLLAGSTVSVQTPEEAEMLPPGTRLRFPDGTYGWAQ